MFTSQIKLLIAYLLFATAWTIEAIQTDELGPAPKHCSCDKGNTCEVDGYVGSEIIYEDEMVRVWNFTLAPGEMTSMHRHDHDYHFIAMNPTQLEVYGEDGSRLFDFRAEGVLGFKVEGEYLKPIGIELPWPVPVVHAAKNIGDDYYYEILFESKGSDSSFNLGSKVSDLLSGILAKKKRYDCIYNRVKDEVDYTTVG